MLDLAAKLVLGPLLYAQARRLRATALDLPEPHGPRSGVEGSGAPLSVLVAGDSSAAGVGARTQDEALALPMARQLAALARRQVRWQLIAQTGFTSEALLHELMLGHARPAQIAVVIVGVNDITREVPLAYALRKRAEIAGWLRAHVGARALLYAGLPEMERFPAVRQPLAFYAGQAARRNNRAQARWARQMQSIHPGLRHLPMDNLTRPELMSEDGFHPAPALYARVAQRLAEAIATEVLPQWSAPAGS
ncbi:MAG: SGNH/GDSL hydrolase family protein [Betaproteobacteria bacterium]